jgi:hypothetical protein
LKEWTTPDFQNMALTTNVKEEEIVDALGNDGNASMPEQVNRRNPWRKMMNDDDIFLSISALQTDTVIGHDIFYILAWSDNGLLHVIQVQSILLSKYRMCDAMGGGGGDRT